SLRTEGRLGRQKKTLRIASCEAWHQEPGLAFPFHSPPRTKSVQGKSRTSPLVTQGTRTRSIQRQRKRPPESAALEHDLDLQALGMLVAAVVTDAAVAAAASFKMR